jgi:hypothetical protein
MIIYHLISMYLFRLIQIVNLWYALYGMQKLTRSMICADRPVRPVKERAAYQMCKELMILRSSRVSSSRASTCFLIHIYVI